MSGGRGHARRPVRRSALYPLVIVAVLLGVYVIAGGPSESRLSEDERTSDQ